MASDHRRDLREVLVMLLSIGFVVGAAIAAPVFFLIGRFARIDRTISHEPADIGPALRRSR